MIRNPKEVISKNLQAPVSAFDNLPSGQLYIFNGTPAPTNISAQNTTGPAGIVPPSGSYTYHFSQQDPFVVPGGSVKIVDSTTFPTAANFAAALVTVEPGAMRELHWHLTSDEWSFFIQGSARITVFPVANSHYVENTGTEDVIFLEVLQQPKFTDISVAQWLALTPKQIVIDTLGLPEETLDSLPKTKTYIKTGNTNLTALAGDPNGTAAFNTSGNA
jgi:oxalate decarboxylase family bicupin protein